MFVSVYFAVICFRSTGVSDPVLENRQDAGDSKRVTSKRCTRSGGASSQWPLLAQTQGGLVTPRCGVGSCPLRRNHTNTLTHTGSQNAHQKLIRYPLGHNSHFLTDTEAHSRSHIYTSPPRETQSPAPHHGPGGLERSGLYCTRVSFQPDGPGPHQSVGPSGLSLMSQPLNCEPQEGGPRTITGIDGSPAPPRRQKGFQEVR